MYLYMYTVGYVAIIMMVIITVTIIVIINTVIIVTIIPQSCNYMLSIFHPDVRKYVVKVIC